MGKMDFSTFGLSIHSRCRTRYSEKQTMCQRDLYKVVFMVTSTFITQADQVNFRNALRKYTGTR